MGIKRNKVGIPVLPIKLTKKHYKELKADADDYVIDKLEILAKSKERCWYCSHPIIFRTSANEGTATLDHVIPRYDGGSDTFENLVAACAKCNHLKGHLSLKKYRIKVFGNTQSLFYGETICQTQD